MAVYVSTLEYRGLIVRGRSVPQCDLLADSEAELVAFARRLLLPDAWRNGHRYEIGRSKRLEALRAGAVEYVERAAVDSVAACLERAPYDGLTMVQLSEALPTLTSDQLRQALRVLRERDAAESWPISGRMVWYPKPARRGIDCD